MNPYEKAQRKAKVLSVLVIAFFLLWTATLFFSETMLYITLGLGFFVFCSTSDLANLPDSERRNDRTRLEKKKAKGEGFNEVQNRG